ncbi:MAG: succinate dehydrogenase, hydrophobic membrane anchor protein [Nevskiales bacterium]|nr:succinate dehydrogenase, hydrophobic membrane anchor protein [Nevskiales bacterium]
MSSPKDLRSPLSRARGLGSAKEGVRHFWAQRVSAVALIPLALWFVFSVVQGSGAGYGAARNWVAAPAVSVLLVLLIVTLLYHSLLGVQVVIEDYVGGEKKKLAALLLSKFTHALVAVAGIFAVLRIALGA